MKKKIISIIFYIISAGILLFYISMELSSRIYMSEFGRLFLLCSSCLSLYFGGLFLSKYKKNNKPMKINLWIFFILYCILLITLTLFDPMWGRNGLNAFKWTGETFKNYLENSINLIPFKTIIEYIKDIFTSIRHTSTIFVNIFGNLVCLMPLALFIPLLFKKINNTKKFLLSVLCVTLGIELIQLITFSGRCDIDDIILNTLGAYIMYKILNIKEIKKLVNNIFLLEKNKINRKKIILILIPIFLVIILCFGLYKICTKYYNENLEEWMYKLNYKVEIIDESSECSNTSKEKFYEDKLYEYYFDCLKSDYVYAKINNGKKYLVKDLLNNNPTEYVVSIDILKRAGLKFTTKDKYNKIKLTLQGDVYINKKEIDEKVLEISWGRIEHNLKDSSYEAFLIPKKSGKTQLIFEVHDNETDKLIKTIKYKIEIDKNLKVNYEEIK